jgi:4-amino-4-deoxy-L-arabinose transferase-like glycosyltransferase
MEETSQRQNLEDIKRKKEKTKTWLRDKENLLLILVLLFTIGIRLYYFWITKNQPLWWDELCYGSLAKNLVTHQWNGTPMIVWESHIRPIFFSIIWAFFISLRFGEVGTRFFLVLLPSVASIFFVYLTGKEVYNKKIGIYSALIFGVIWINLFYTGRLLVHMFELGLFTASMYFFVRSIKSERLNYISFSISLFLLSLATLTRYQDGIIFLAYLVILVAIKRLHLTKSKFWYSGIIGMAPLIAFFAYNWIVYRNIFPALLSGDYLAQGSVDGKVAPIAFNLLNYIPLFLGKIFFIFFLLGLFSFLLNLFLKYDRIHKSPKEASSLLLFLSAAFVFSLFIFVFRAAEDRYFFETLSCLSIFAGTGIYLVENYLIKYGKYLSFFFLAIVLISGTYLEIKQADLIISSKLDSYKPMKEAFEWLGENTNKEAVIIGEGIEPYTIYYSDRNYLQLPKNDSDLSLINSADYLVIHAFVPQPAYLQDYLSKNSSFKPIKSFNVGNNPAVIIYAKS